MKEIDSVREPLFFTFICPKERETEVRELFRELKCGSLSPESNPATRESIGARGVTEIVNGVNLSGLAFRSGIDQIARILAQRRIAGYSKTTQIFAGNFDKVIRKGREDV